MKYKIKPYIELMRLDKRIGIYLALWPCLWSIAISVKQSFPYTIYGFFIAGAILMRSAGCIINDIVDRKIDAEVRRTKHRPLASGKIKVASAVILLLILLTIAAYILYNLNKTTQMLGLAVLLPIFIYPFMKRITYWPQAFLALIFNWGALMGAAAIHDKITNTSLIIYAACFFWTLGYDTIYAHQDKESDALLGVKSTALKLGKNTKKYLYGFYGITIICLWAAGVSADLGIAYHAFLIIGILHLLWQVYEVNLDRPIDCLRKFHSNFFFGLVIFVGIISGYFS